MPPHSISCLPRVPSLGGLRYHFSQRQGKVGDRDTSPPALATSPAFQLSAQISLRGAGCLAPKSPARAKNNPLGSAGGSWHRSAPPWSHRGGASEMPPLGWGTRTERQDLAPLLSQMSLPATGHLKALVPGAEGDGRAGLAVPPVPPLARPGAVPGAAGRKGGWGFSPAGRISAVHPGGCFRGRV